MRTLRWPIFLRFATVLFLLLAGGISLVLFSVKYQVQDLEGTQKRLKRELGDERRALHVLRAEWAQLNTPERLRTLAVKIIGMAAIRPDQLRDVAAVKAIPLRNAPRGDKAGSGGGGVK